MSNLFNVNMTSSEARMALYAAFEGKTKEEQDSLYYEEYLPIARKIRKHELELAQQGWMMS